jgi:hypothetical protein
MPIPLHQTPCVEINKANFKWGDVILTFALYYNYSYCLIELHLSTTLFFNSRDVSIYSLSFICLDIVIYVITIFSRFVVQFF